MTQRTSVSDGLTRQVLRMDEDFVRQYPGGTAKLELAKGHPDVKARTYALWEQLAKERELMLPLTDRGPRYTAETGEFKTPEELIAAYEEAGGKYYDRFYPTDLLSRVKLTQEKGSMIESYRVTPSDLGHTENRTRRDTIYAEAGHLGFGQLIQEYGALLALKLARQLKETGTCDLEIGEWFVVATEPIVGSDGRLRLLVVKRHEDGVYLDWYYGYPDYEWDPDSQFLFVLLRK